MIKHRKSPQWGDSQPCLTTLAIGLSLALAAALCMVVAVVFNPGAEAGTARPAIASSDFTGSYGTMKVPAACNTPQANLRYYTDAAPAGTAFLRSGAHGHGGYLRCIYFYVDGPLTGTDHHYGKWLVFTANGGQGLLIGPDGIEASYVNCALPGYHFPFPAGNGQPNDCGESWVGGEGEPYFYQDNTAGFRGQPMFPAVLP